MPSYIILAMAAIFGADALYYYLAHDQIIPHNLQDDPRPVIRDKSTDMARELTLFATGDGLTPWPSQMAWPSDRYQSRGVWLPLCGAAGASGATNPARSARLRPRF